MPKDIVRAIIETTVDRGLREIDEDPRRSIRKLLDMGRQFSKNKFVEELYGIFQDLLRNNESPYYTAMERLLHYTDRKCLKHCGINVGYNSFYKGGKIIRKLQSRNRVMIPWCITLRINPLRDDSLTLPEVSAYISQGQKTGIFTYGIRIGGNLSCLEGILKLVRSNSDSAFFIFLPDCEISEDDLKLIKQCTNSVIFLQASTDSFYTNASSMRRQKSWYATYEHYSDSDYRRLLSHESTWDCISEESAFHFMIAKGECSAACRKDVRSSIKKMRMAPTVPMFFFDFYGDVTHISNLISGHPTYLEFISSKQLLTQDGYVDLDEPLALEGILKKYFAQDEKS